MTAVLHSRLTRTATRLKFYRPTWAEVDLGLLKGNLARLKKIAGKAEVLFVVKADGYGHGALEVSRAAAACGVVRWLGVSSVEEGVLLREGGVRLPILILGSLYPFESTLAAIRYGLTPTVASLEGARRVAEAARRLGRRHPLSCHLKLDTGMGRIGVSWPAGLEAALYLARTPGVRLEGMYTHLACAETDPAYTRLQLGRFQNALADLAGSGIRPMRHAAASAAAVHAPQSRLDMIRPGLAAYGLYEDFEPILSLKTRIVFLKNVKAGTPISYGGLYRTRRASRIATLPIGYADGVPRVLSLPGRSFSVLVRGRRCPAVGVITMDMLMVDVTGVEGVRVGEEAVIIGRSGKEEVTAREIALAAGTIPYEIVSNLKNRVPRLYLP